MIKGTTASYHLLSAKAIEWVRQNRLEATLLAITILVGAFFRLYRIDEYMTFLGDEGRDALVVRRLLVKFDPILIGPGTSIGNMYLGPLYYYLMAPFLLLANFSPVGPAVMIALLGIATIFFVWKITREWFGKLGAFVAASLYAVSPVVITFSKSSWNPNIMPFFSLLTIYSIWKFWNESKFKWLIVTGVSMAFVLQSHYLGLLLIPVVGLFWSLKYLSNQQSQIANQRSIKRGYLKYSIIGLIAFSLLMSPLLIFDLRHNFMNMNSMKRFFLERQTTVSARPWTAIPKIPEIATSVVTRLIAAGDEVVGKWITVGVVFIVLWLILLNWKKMSPGLRDKYYLLLSWIGFALIGLGVYKQHIYDHYYGFFFTAPFIFLGGLTRNLIDFAGTKNLFPKLLFYLFLLTAYCILLATNLFNNPLKYSPSRQLQRTEVVAEKIIEESGGEKFNIAVIAERNYEDAYQYFLEWRNAPYIEIDAQRLDETVTNQLFVICEMEKEKCDPVHSPKTEIANFGWSVIEAEWELAGTTLYKLGHSL